MKYLPAVIVIFLAGCVSFGTREKGNGQMVSEIYQVSDFTSIRIGGFYSVLLIPSREERLEVEIDENLVEYFRAEVSGNTLDIYNSEKIFSEEGIQITIYYKEIEEISVSGAVELKNEDILISDRFTVEMSGAGSLKMNIEVNDLIIGISGAGAVELDGQADYQRIRMSGAGGYSGFDLESNRAKIEISGLGSADIWVRDELDASISGVGDINYKGDPSLVNSDIGGLGSINKAD